jgi:hypothetical protein
MKFTEAKRKYRNSWIAFQYTDRDRNTGKVLVHDKDRNRFHEKLMARKKPFKDVYLKYTGSLIPKGMVVVLCSK